jgi:NodT family efflux transporter outer membrane factor (OMF) lipoprotein
MKTLAFPARTALAAALATTALTGCTVGPNYVAPDIAPPASFAAAQAAIPGANVDPAHWWQAFGDPTLDALVVKGLADSPDMAIAASRVRQSRLQEIAARAQGLPTLGTSAGVNHTEFSKNAGLATIAQAFTGGSSGSGNSSGIALPGSGITTYSVGFDASWEIDLFGGVRRGVEGARARSEAAEWSQRDAAVTLAAEIADAYFALRLDQTQLDVIQQEIVRDQRGLDIAGNIAKVGLAPQIDVTRQRASITATQARLEPIRADMDVRIHALGILTGQPPEALLGALRSRAPALAPAPAVPAGLPSELLRRRPDIRAAERQLAGATADIGVAVSDLYPKFSLTGMAQLISTGLGNLFSTDSAQLTGNAGIKFPILDWGRRKATIASRKEDREQAYQQYRSTVLGALRDVEDALVRIDTEQRRNAALKRGLADSEATAHSVEGQYRTGLVAQTALLDAQGSVLQAREQLAGSDSQLRQHTAALFKALGGGWDAGTGVQ